MASQPQTQGHLSFQQKYIKGGHSDHVQSVAFSPDGQHLASASDDKTIKLWEVESGTLINTLKGHSGVVKSIAFSPDGHHLASASNDRTIRLWGRFSGAQIATLVEHSSTVWRAVFSPDGLLLASASGDSTIRLWGMGSNTHVATLDTGDAMTCIAFSPDGRYLAATTSRNVQLWEVASRSKVKTMEGHTNLVLCLAFSPDGALLTSGSDDKTIRFWNASSGDHIATIRNLSSLVRSIAFFPDGTVLASAEYDGTISLWDVASKSRIAIVATDIGWVCSISLSPDGSRLACGLEAGKIYVWQRAEKSITNDPPTKSPLAVATIAPQNPQDVDSPTPSPPGSPPAESPPAAYTPADSTDSDISRFVILTDNDRISSGGFGDLFLGAHEELGKVAMKRPHVLLNEASLRRFLREVHLWQSMSHRYILPCLGTCRIGREVYMVSPFVENGDLMSCMQRGMVLNRSKLLYEVSEALAHLHHRGIVHGDVKAQNVLLSSDGSALLCDFGLAKTFDTMATSTEAKGSGSVRWMAPELLTGESGRRMATDVYSFGLTIAEVLSGSAPFSHIVENMAVMFHVVLKNGRPTKEPSSSPEGKSYSVLWETAEKCWVTEPNDRPFMAQVLGMLFPLTREK